jgi:hypothetical protein
LAVHVAHHQAACLLLFAASLGPSWLLLLLLLVCHLCCKLQQKQTAHQAPFNMQNMHSNKHNTTLHPVAADMAGLFDE